MATEEQQPTTSNRPRYGDLDDDDDDVSHRASLINTAFSNCVLKKDAVDREQDEYLSDDYPRQNGDGAAADEEDDEYTKEQRAADLAAAQALPANVKNFITSLRSAMSSSNVGQIHNLYSSAFPRLTHEHFSQIEWPEVEVVSMLADGNEVFGIFYKELYFRHIYSRLSPNIDDRFSSYENYCAIFNYILNSGSPVPLELPVQWLWDIIDEFVYQFSSFSTWRSRPKGKTEDEVTMLAENPQVWSCYSVLNVLYSLIQKSKILDQLKAVKRGESQEAIDEIAGEYGKKPLYKMLGLYSVVTLIRVHALLGDYTLALKMLDDIDIKKLPTRDVPAVHVSLHYYIGFSYIMLQRYSDAIYHLSRGYLFFAGPKRGRALNAGPGGDAIAKQADRMLALLGIAHALSPTRWEDSREVREARDALRMSDKHNEQFEIINRGGGATKEVLAAYEELFRYGAPKSISPQAPPYHEPSRLESYPDSFQHTVSLFLNDIEPTLAVADLRTLLKLYTSISTTKLATLAGKDEKELVRELLLLKGIIKAVKWTESVPASSSSSSSPEDSSSSNSISSLLNAEETVTGNLGFSVDGNTIHITEQRRARQFTGRFLAQGIAAKQLLDQLKSRPLPAPVLASGPGGNPNVQSHDNSASQGTAGGANREGGERSSLRPSLRGQGSNAPSQARTAGGVAWAK